MAKVRLVMAMTLDGFLPDENHPLMRWVETDRHGFPYWRERSSFDLPVGYPMISLIRKREDSDVSFVYSAEITGIHKMPLLQALLLYGMVDEWVVYLLPLTQGAGTRLTDGFKAARWKVVSTDTYKNGVCRTVYRQ